ncbi:MAG: HAD-IC family P-type ATPase [Candidatus Komeilibacteria bacterium]|nr:HAD-IC family P-type ATPase [Candidatus Komeilibacteria bacterium]
MAQFSQYTNKTADSVLSLLSSDKTAGLNPAEVAKQLSQHGPNEVSESVQGWIVLLRRQFESPFIYLLLVAAILAYALGERIDGSMIVLFVLINATIGFYQEFRSEQTLKLLRQYVIKETRVRRGGSEQLIPSRELVPGDVVIIEPGDVLAADMRVIDETNLVLDESVLTGEAVPVEKNTAPLREQATEIFNASNIVFSGTSVASGKGLCVVIATGRDSILGNVSKLTAETVRVSGFAKGIGRFSSFILRLVMVTLIFIVLVNIALKGTSNVADLIIFAIALAVSVIPEALPVVTTFSLSRGALHLSKHHVIVKRLSAIEDLGSIEVLCTDKTGTLTENALTVADLFSASDAKPVFLASLGAPFLTEKKKQPNNAFDIALWAKLPSHDRERVHAYSRIDEIPFDPVRRRNSVITAAGSDRELIVRGAPEDVIPLCVGQREIRARIESWLAQAGTRGQRVIAVAHKRLAQQHGTLAAEERELHFAGLISFIDPLKKTTKDAVAKAKRLGVAVKILTGDSKEVAGAVAYEIGLVSDVTHGITGAEFDRLDPQKRRAAVDAHAVFARVSPQQKYEIIKVLQETHLTGFLGEGINDAPALKIADVALVVQGASGIAQEAADIVLLKKSLQVIVDGIHEGRSVFVNTVKYIKATLASNFGNFYAVAIASLLIPFLPMLPIQILLVNLLSDFPMIAIAADTVDASELKKPKGYDIKEIVLIATVLGIVSTVFDFIMFALFYRISPEVLQTNWFIGSILTELVFLFSVRTRLPFFKTKRPSAVLLWLSLTAFVATIMLPYIPYSAKLFHFTPPSPKHLVMILAVVSVYFIITETVKIMYYRMQRA